MNRFGQTARRVPQLAVSLCSLIRRDDDHRYFSQGGVLFLLGPKLPAVHDGHHQVEQDQRRQAGAGPELVQRLLPVGRGGHVVAQRPQHQHHGAPGGRVIFDDENSLFAFHHRKTLRRAPTRSATPTIRPYRNPSGPRGEVDHRLSRGPRPA